MNTAYIRSSLPAFLLSLAVSAVALGGEATDQVKRTTDKILVVLQDASLKSPDKQEERRAQIRKVAGERFDWVAMARSAMGKSWHDLTDAQHTEFTSLFTRLIERTYMDKVENYSGETITYKGDKVEDRYATVNVLIRTLQGTDIPVSYRMMKEGPEWLAYDITIEGVSLVNNYRSQIASILSKSSYDVLIKKLEANVAGQASAGPQPAPEGKEGGL